MSFIVSRVIWNVNFFDFPSYMVDPIKAQLSHHVKNHLSNLEMIETQLKLHLATLKREEQTLARALKHTQKIPEPVLEMDLDITQEDIDSFFDV